MSEYPFEPGFKEGDTSREAARATKSRARELRRKTYAFIVANPGLSSDQIAAGLGEHFLSIRPRVTELRQIGLVRNEGRGRNPSGCSVHLWRASAPSDQTATIQKDLDEEIDF